MICSDSIICVKRRTVEAFVSLCHFFLYICKLLSEPGGSLSSLDGIEVKCARYISVKW